MGEIRRGSGRSRRSEGKLELLPEVAGLARIAEEAYSWGGFTLDRVDVGESTTPAR